VSPGSAAADHEFHRQTSGSLRARRPLRMASPRSRSWEWRCWTPAVPTPDMMRADTGAPTSSATHDPCAARRDDGHLAGQRTHAEPDNLHTLTVVIDKSAQRAESAIWSVFEIGGTRSAGVSRCRCGVIQPVQRAPQRADPARLRTVAPTGRAAAQEVAGGWRVSEETGARARPGRKGNRCQPSPPGACPSWPCSSSARDRPRITGCPAGCPESAAWPGTARSGRQRVAAATASR